MTVGSDVQISSATKGRLHPKALLNDPRANRTRHEAVTAQLIDLLSEMEEARMVELLPLLLLPLLLMHNAPATETDARERRTANLTGRSLMTESDEDGEEEDDVRTSPDVEDDGVAEPHEDDV
ncbi:hypothetical protein HDU88_006367 [Geranomyces variabilis]|nr:hypothetical protein HDU88_006367 [Geranomyces variabilis]